MNHLVLNDALVREDLFPFGQLQSVADVRIGILTIREKWERFFGIQVSLTRDVKEDRAIPANLIPDEIAAQAFRSGDHHYFIEGDNRKGRVLHFPWQIAEWNDAELRADFERITRGRVSQAPSPSNRVISPGSIFIEAGARVEYCILNASTGPIYIGKNAEIMEGAMVRGPFALCEGAVVKMGAIIYGATTVGPYAVVGGEIKNSVIGSFSNKSHHGYLGDSVIGDWCNLGAGTSNSNLKNNASRVKVWNRTRQEFLHAGQKCGLLMGDYSRSAINTSFTTGTVAGICCNIFGGTTPPRYLPNFSWGQGGGGSYLLEKAFDDISKWKQLKNRSLTKEEKQGLAHIFANSLK